MRPDVEAATERVAALRARLTGAGADAQEFEDALSEGYAQALAGDAWVARVERELHERIDDPSRAAGGRALREIAGERARLERSIIALRDELAGLRADRDTIRGESRIATG